MSSATSDRTKEQPAKASDKPTAPAAAVPVPATLAEPTTQQAIRIDDSGAQTCYANFCRVTGTPEELIIDFGLNSQPMGVPTEPIVIHQRLVTNYFTAKRMLHALQMTLQRHESTFGVLETNIQKRVQNPRG